jgi:hypothetical protein
MVKRPLGLSRTGASRLGGAARLMMSHNHAHKVAPRQIHWRASSAHPATGGSDGGDGSPDPTTSMTAGGGEVLVVHGGSRLFRITPLHLATAGNRLVTTQVDGMDAPLQDTAEMQSNEDASLDVPKSRAYRETS